MYYLMIVAMAATACMLGGLWYSPALFGKAWRMDGGMTADSKQGHPARVFGVAFIFSLVAAAAFAEFLHALQVIGGANDLATAMSMGAGVGFLIAGTSFGINYQFANRPLRMWAIDAGYHTVQFALYGLVFALWPK